MGICLHVLDVDYQIACKYERVPAHAHAHVYIQHLRRLKLALKHKIYLKIMRMH
jgi:hypothetical protein